MAGIAFALGEQSESECFEPLHREEANPGLFTKLSPLDFGASGVIRVAAPARGLALPRAESFCP